MFKKNVIAGLTRFSGSTAMTTETIYKKLFIIRQKFRTGRNAGRRN
jgi:hypothetical protein